VGCYQSERTDLNRFGQIGYWGTGGPESKWFSVGGDQRCARNSPSLTTQDSNVACHPGRSSDSKYRILRASETQNFMSGRMLLLKLP